MKIDRVKAVFKNKTAAIRIMSLKIAKIETIQ